MTDGSAVAEAKEGKTCGITGEQDPKYLCKILYKWAVCGGVPTERMNKIFPLYSVLGNINILVCEVLCTFGSNDASTIRSSIQQSPWTHSVE